MSKEDEISKGLDVNSEGDSTSEELPKSTSNGLNGHETPTPASEHAPQDTGDLGSQTPVSNEMSSSTIPEQPELNHDQNVEGQETAKKETQAESQKTDAAEPEPAAEEPEATQKQTQESSVENSSSDAISTPHEAETPKSEEPIAKPSEEPAIDEETRAGESADEVIKAEEIKDPVQDAAVEEKETPEAPAADTETKDKVEEVKAPKSEELIAKPSEEPAIDEEARAGESADEVIKAEEIKDPVRDAAVEEKEAPEVPEAADTETTDKVEEVEPSAGQTASDVATPAEGGEVAPKPEDQSAVDKATPPTEPEGVKVEAPAWTGIDYGTLEKVALVELVEVMAKHDNAILAEKASRQLRPHFMKIQKTARQAALEAFTAEGNEPDGFAYRFDELDNRFDAAYKLLRDRKFQQVKSLERDKEKNLEEKTQLLEELRALVEAEETTSSINSLKKIQERWRNLGPVPGQHAKTMWANYHALLDLYYDHRSIYFELKELDRKKNLVSKLELCDRAEKLVDNQNLREAISELNELHEEFKHLGPVPKSEQEALWQRFKGASDQIYARRKEFVKHLKEDLKINLTKKAELAEEVQEYFEFTSDRITDWNKKTKALLDLQKRWDAIGGLPRENAKEINRKFWGAFKGFFQHKGQFFKKLEGERGANLEKKQALVDEAVALKDSTDWNDTSNKLKNLQKQWREIGPVPEKQRNEIYAKFKEACDHFFNNRRAQSQEIEKEYVVNLQKKQDICTQIEVMTTSKAYDLDKFQELKDSFNAIGYVPSSEVRNIREQFKRTVGDYLDGAPEELAEEAKRMKDTLEFEKLTKGPNASRKKGQKEQSLRREISGLENDVSTWKNNLEFFAASKTADKLREEFTDKINDANDELLELKRQLRALRQL